MALYTQETLDRVKDAVDMVELVGARTDLRRAGSGWKGLCPFHDERTPSFSVNAQDKVYYCFGCGESGDGIRFVQETEALDFPQAIEFLAQRYGIELEREQEDPRAAERRRHRERLLAVLERATAFYARFLWEADEAKAARDYLAGRGLEQETLREFRVGYAPSAWDRILTAAQRDGFSPQELAAAGLTKQARGGRGAYDFFRARIMFPLADPRGKVLGFGGRSMGEGEQAKYVNTAETELYRKGRQLFGIDRARAAAAKAGRVVAVEGYTDVLALHQAGVTESVALMGTALTPEQLALLGRTAPSVLLALDADRSGLEAMRGAAKEAHSRGVELRAVELPPGRDPAELVSEDGAEAFAALLGASLSVPEFEARRVLADADVSTARGKDQALERIRPLIGALERNSATRDDLVRFVADKLDLPSDYLMTTLSAQAPAPAASGQWAPAREHAQGAAPARPDREPSTAASAESILRAERAFLTMCVALGNAGRPYLDRIGDEHLSTTSLRSTRDWLREHFDAPLSALTDDDAALAAAVTEIVMRAEEEPASAEVLELSYLQLELRRCERLIRAAEREGDRERQRELWAERERVREQVDTKMKEN